MAGNGYAGEILKVDLSAGTTERLRTADYAEKFLGGKGIAIRLYWEMAPPQAGAFDPENILVCVNGPVAGFPGFAGNRWLACGKTAAGELETFSWGNLGGTWGVRLKYAGYDGIVVRGKAERPVYLFVHNGEVEIRDASHLWGKNAFETGDALKVELGQEVSVAAIGQAGERLVAFSNIITDEGASGSGGVGSIMGSKNLKAIAVAGDRKPEAADPERLRELAGFVHELTKGPPMGGFPWDLPGRTRQQACYGCGIGCPRGSYSENGRRYKLFCQQTDIYRRPALKYYNGWNDVVLLATRLCDGYGLDCSAAQAMIEWIIGCYKHGILTEENTGLPLSKIGSQEFIEILTRKIAYREGFGDLLAQGTIKAAAAIGGKAKELISYSVMNRTGELRDYDPRLVLHNALPIATEPRKPVQPDHEPISLLFVLLSQGGWASDKKQAAEITRQITNRFWGSTESGDYTTYAGKALAAKRMQDRSYALESLVLCNSRWPMIAMSPEKNAIGGPALAARIFSAITGREMDELEMERIGERIFNLQRAALIRQGWGGRSGDILLKHQHEEPIQYLRYNRECKVAGQDAGITSRKGEVVVREEFEKMKDEYYALRGWDASSGLQTRAGLAGLQLEDAADDLEKRGLLK
jgi:aldehyde:ferredoxin oxidoreductase